MRRLLLFGLALCAPALAAADEVPLPDASVELAAPAPDIDAPDVVPVVDLTMAKLIDGGHLTAPAGVPTPDPTAPAEPQHRDTACASPTRHSHQPGRAGSPPWDASHAAPPPRWVPPSRLVLHPDLHAAKVPIPAGHRPIDHPIARS